MLAWRRDTVTSSRKMSLSGWRPAETSSLSSTKRDPAPGPRFTTSTPAPSGRSSSPTATSSSPPASASTGVRVNVWSSPRTSSGAPQDEQKLAPGGLRCPQLLQKTSATLRSRSSAVDEPAVALGVEQAVQLGGVLGLEDAQPAVAVGVLVQAFRGVGQVVVDLHHDAPHGGVDVGDGLGRLHLGERRPRFHLGADGGQLHEDHVAQGVLGVVRDPHAHPAVLEPRPLVVLRVPQAFGDVHGPADYRGRGAGLTGSRAHGRIRRRILRTCSDARRRASPPEPASAHTWVTGSSGSGRARTQPSTASSLTPSMRTSSPVACSMSWRMTPPFCSHGVDTRSWATWARGRPATTFDRGVPVLASSSSSLAKATMASYAGRKA